jgi:hypothetical protein
VFITAFDVASSYCRTKARVCGLSGDTLRGMRLCDSSLSYLTNRPPDVNHTFSVRIDLALTYAGFGRKQEAIRLA